MTKYWIGSDKEYTDYLIEYAARLKTSIPKDASLLACVGDDGNLNGFGGIVATKELADIVFLYVSEENRGQGIGGELLSEMENMAVEVGIHNIRCFVPHENANLVFFIKRGYDLCEGPREYEVPFAMLKYSEAYCKNIAGKAPKKAKALEKCSRIEKLHLMQFFDKNGIVGVDSFDKRLSAVIFERQEVTSLLLGESNTKGVIIHYMLTDKEHPELLVDCLRVMDKAISAGEKADSDLMLSFATGNEFELSLLKHISGETALIQEFSRYCVALKRM